MLVENILPQILSTPNIMSLVIGTSAIGSSYYPPYLWPLFYVSQLAPPPPSPPFASFAPRQTNPCILRILYSNCKAGLMQLCSTTVFVELLGRCCIEQLIAIHKLNDLQSVSMHCCSLSVRVVTEVSSFIASGCGEEEGRC